MFPSNFDVAVKVNCVLNIVRGYITSLVSLRYGFSPAHFACQMIQSEKAAQTTVRRRWKRWNRVLEHKVILSHTRFYSLRRFIHSQIEEYTHSAEQTNEQVSQKRAEAKEKKKFTKKKVPVSHSERTATSNELHK